MAKVLIVEDNLINQELLTEMLERLGCSVQVAENGREALKELQSAAYDLIFMDLQMPEMDGFEASKEIRKSFNTPIIALTANIMDSTKRRCFDVGMSDYMTKPFDMQDVEDILGRYCS